MKTKRQTTLRILDVLALLLAIATFSPLVIPIAETNPSLFGIPYSMWVSFVVSILFVVLAYMVSLTTKKEEDAD